MNIEIKLISRLIKVNRYFVFVYNDEIVEI